MLAPFVVKVRLSNKANLVMPLPRDVVREREDAAQLQAWSTPGSLVARFLCGSCIGKVAGLPVSPSKAVIGFCIY